MTTVAIIQARTGSTRLPNKIFTPILQQPVLLHVAERLRRARTLDRIAIATSTVAGDDTVATFCATQQLHCTRGSETDVLSRYIDTIAALQLADHDVVVRITADCPCIDPNIVDDIVTARACSNAAYCSNVLERHFPRGLDAEACTVAALRAAHRAADAAEREHVTLHLVRHPEIFSHASVTTPIDHHHWRWTIDTPDDLCAVTKIFEHFGHNRFSWHDAAAFCAQYPDVMALNQHIAQKTT